jgi:two-component sensor histidine kinase
MEVDENSYLIITGDRNERMVIEESLRSCAPDVLCLPTIAETLRTAVFHSPFSFIIIDAPCWIDANDGERESFLSAFGGMPLFLLVVPSDAGLIREVRDIPHGGYLVKGSCAGLYESSVSMALALHREKIKSGEAGYTSPSINARTDAVVIVDAEYRVLALNDKAAQCASETIESLRGRFLHELAEPALCAKLCTWVDAAIRGRRMVSRKDEHDSRHFEHRIYPVFSPGGAVDGCVIHARGIAENVHADNPLCPGGTSPGGSCRGVPESVVVTDVNGTILAGGDILHRRCDDGHGHAGRPGLRDYMPAVEDERVKAVIAEVVAGGRRGHIDVVSGEDAYDMYLYPLKDSGGRVTRLVMFRLEKNAREEAGRPATLVHEIGHRVRNTMMSLLGLILVEEQFGHAPVYGEGTSLFERIAQRVYGLLEVHSMLSDKSWTDIALYDLINRLVDMSIKNLPSGMRVEKTITGSGIRVSPRQANGISLIINELVTNSVKHAFAGRETMHLDISLTGTPGMIELVFRDDGPGFPPEVLASRGRGAGLYIIRRLVEHDLRGGIELSNDNGAVCLMRYKIDG